MKLLIITQAIDTENPVLGFFHRWVEEFAKRVDSIEVICLERGVYHLPENVRVHSLGKEHGRATRVAYARRFLKLVKELRNEYDLVFVHMNEEYVLLAGLLWVMWRKPIFFWRNHKVGSWRTNVATLFATKLFCTSPFAYIAKKKKTELMPVGIDTDFFVMGISERKERSVLSLGRIAPVKRLEVLLEACKILQEKNVEVLIEMYGDALPVDAAYAESLKDYAKEHQLANVQFDPGVPNADTPKVYQSHYIFVNLTNTGSFDKTLFEAMACGALIVTSNEGLRQEIPAELFFKEYDPQSLAGALERTLALPEAIKDQYRKGFRVFVEEHHSLNLLIERLMINFKKAYEGSP